MDQGLGGSDEYLAQWQWSPMLERPEPVDQLIAQLIAETPTRG